MFKYFKKKVEYNENTDITQLPKSAQVQRFLFKKRGKY
jgi:hypothetical protein